MGPITIELVAAPSPEVRALVGELEEILAAEYPPEQRHGLSIEAIFEPHVRFFVARDDTGAIGCGGVALFGGFAEVKRMYVREAARGRGVAEAILARIEREASTAGERVLYLETGTRQIAAQRFYGRLGFAPCEAFGAYASMPPHAVATSVFMQKRLDAPSRPPRA